METDIYYEKIIYDQYNMKVLMGNWFERQFRKEEKIKSFLDARLNESLLFQKIEKLFKNYFKDIILEPSCQYIRVGDVVQIVAPDFDTVNGCPFSVAISTAFSTVNVLNSQEIDGNSIITFAPFNKPVIRNSFRIIRPHFVGIKLTPDNELIRYGEDFCLKFTDPEVDMYLYATTDVSQEYEIYRDGEICHGISLCPQKDLDINSLALSIPPSDCRFKCVFYDPEYRYENEGEPVKANDKLLIVHNATNRYLCGEVNPILTMFGKEQGLTCVPRNVINKIDKSQLTWILKTDSEN